MNSETFYLGDSPETSIQEWADLIRKNLGKRKNMIFPVSLLRIVALAGDLLKTIGWTDPPITTFRLNNMLTGSHYPIEKTHEVVGGLPYTLEDGVRDTLVWMYEQKLIHNKPNFVNI